LENEYLYVPFLKLEISLSGIMWKGRPLLYTSSKHIFRLSYTAWKENIFIWCPMKGSLLFSALYEIVFSDYELD
jgi:hypothetical protein